ncbi:lipase family protein [Nocardia sp. CDC159]|uniref:Lipase family protein n=1 Tax=Nocardia pulmonis TaxID=2951408 RepID=A0A9X2IZH3_9NOCA|nr:MULTISPECIES: lipase family protein [Nocardia]MCM6778072.1 lipase family protein [Nocardia pulmonis]MCM6790961.1 lipase family protein [Nocardia sp. CDC159]
MSVTVFRAGRRRPWQMLLGLVAVCAVAAVQSGAVATAEPQPVPVQPALPFPVPPAPPEFDPAFYNPPADVVAAKQPGDIIAAREVHLAFYSVIPFNIDAWQLSFRSTNTRGEPIAAVTTVMKPRGDNGGQPRNLLSYQFPVDSLAKYCAPSYALQQASIPGQITGQFDIPFEFVAPLTALGAGWAVAMPDHDGPNTAFAAGPLEGRITLDGIRAAENFAPMGLPGRDTKVGMAGYSGGAIATTHAAELHASYAPDLNIVGAMSGGNQPDLRDTIRLANNNLGSGLILSGMIGVAREYPELAEYYQQHMNDFGKALLGPPKNSLCLWGAGILPFVNIVGLFDSPNPFDDPVPTKVFDEISLGHSVPDMPEFLYQSNPDEFAPVGAVNRLVEKYCQDPNARLTYVRDNFSEHISLEILAMPRVLVWLKDRFDGVPVPNGCDIRQEGSMTLDPATWPVWLQGVNTLLRGILQQPIGSR